MTDTAPPIAQLLGRLCGASISAEDYVGFFLNEHGEELVFAQTRGEKTARLWHSEVIPTTLSGRIGHRVASRTSAT